MHSTFCTASLMQLRECQTYLVTISAGALHACQSGPLAIQLFNFSYMLGTSRLVEGVGCRV